MSKKYQIIQSESRVYRETSVQVMCTKVWNGTGLVVLLLGLILSLMGNAFAAPQDETFLAARDAYRAGKFERFNEYAQQLDGYVLQPYIAYWQLQSHMAEATPAEIRSFLTRYEESPLADRLRKDWLVRLGKSQQWGLFLSEFPALLTADKDVSCYALQARLSQGNKIVLQEAKPIWFDAADLPSSCAPIFDSLFAEGMLTRDDVWIRIRLALEAGNVGVAKAVIQYLPSGQAPDPRTLDRIVENPHQFLEKNKLNFKSRTDRELAMFAVYRIARTQLLQAQTDWEKMREHFSAMEQSYVWGHMAFYAARVHDPVALNWFKQIDNASLNDNQLGWKVRAALRAQDWPEVLASIQAMSEVEQRNGVWRYWKARALSAQGKVVQANTIYAPLSKETHFYGQLANEELGVVAGNPTESYKASEEEIREVKNLPGLRRALVLYQLDLRTDANREWAWALRGFDDKQLLAAAELARRNEWYDRAIYTADKTVQLHDFSLRYLAPHRDVMQIYANKWGLDEAWVYGLIRQESRFVRMAQSSVGASGLMQIMPATAKWIANRLGIKDFKGHLVNELDTNISFGTYYLKYVQDSLDGSPVLATAGYNAGPSRARRWRDNKAMEGAVYAESIPFNETRDYVKKVMSNAMYYSNRFGQHLVTLKQRMGTIGGKSKGSDPEQGEENN